MILHYLGLDHIGHKSGPRRLVRHDDSLMYHGLMARSPHMPAKQTEMDDVVRTIYSAMESQSHLQSSVFILCGDHGMNEAGNHGGSSAGEVSTALLFVSPKFVSAFDGFESPSAGKDSFQFYETVEQSDIAPTLAALLGFPFPRNNLGVVIPRLLDLWTHGM